MDDSGPGRDVKGRFEDAAGDSAGRKKYTVGVPLPRLIPYRFSALPEIVMLRRPRSPAGTEFRRLAAELAAIEEGGPQVVVVTSPGAREGRSLVSVNLALAMAAESAQDVLLLNADFRGASIDGWIEPAPKVGLAEMLRGETGLEHVILDLQNAPLKVLPAGTPPGEPAALLAAGSGEALLRDLRGRFERIVIDTPPVEECNDADMVGGWSDGILMVVRAHRTRESSFLRALSSVTSGRIVGTVFNDEIV
jgi:capsular exopolysaccharide synthesis family protein